MSATVMLAPDVADGPRQQARACRQGLQNRVRLSQNPARSVFNDGDLTDGILYAEKLPASNACLPCVGTMTTLWIDLGGNGLDMARPRRPPAKQAILIIA